MLPTFIYQTTCHVQIKVGRYQYHWCLYSPSSSYYTGDSGYAGGFTSQTTNVMEATGMAAW